MGICTLGICTLFKKVVLGVALVVLATVVFVICMDMDGFIYLFAIMRCQLWAEPGDGHHVKVYVHGL